MVVAQVAGQGLTIDGNPVATEPSMIARALADAVGEVVSIRGDAAAADELVALVVEQTQDQGQPRREVWLELPDLKLQLSAAVYRSEERRHASLLVVVSDKARIWLIRNDDGSFQELGASSLDADAAELSTKLVRACAAGCDASLTIEQGRPFVTTVRRWLSVAGDSGAIGTNHVSVTRATQVAKMPDGSTAGRLPPEVIQGIVRARFSEFRACYEQGLARNSNLAGKISARFVIGLDGAVRHVTDGGSDIPDTTVRDCVLEKFKTFVFPKPEGGIVTVVYPIMLAPG